MRSSLVLCAVLVIAGQAGAQPIPDFRPAGPGTPLPAAEIDPDINIDGVPCGGSLWLPDGSEVIFVCESATCSEEGSIDLGGVCVGGDFLGELCKLYPEFCGVAPEPELPPADPPVLTNETCAQAREQCNAEVGGQQGSCEAAMTQAAGLTAGNDRTCFGNTEMLVESIQVDVMPDVFGCEVDPLCQPISFQCGMSDLRSSGNLASIACRLEFRRLAMRQCMAGFPETSNTEPKEISGKLTLAGFAEIGVKGGNTITTTVPAGAGLRDHCGALAREGFKTCTAMENQCRVQAEGAAQVGVSEPPIEDILARIDRQRLGLNDIMVPAEAGFRGTNRGKLEPESLFYGRMRFLAAWSEFLAEHNVSPIVQGRIQLALQRTQEAYRSAQDDLVARAIGAWLIDPRTGEVGTEEMRRLFLEFVRQGELTRRGTLAEETLMQEVSLLLDTRIEAFRERVWPGIVEFGYTQPMRPRQTVLPPPLAPGQPVRP